MNVVMGVHDLMEKESLYQVEGAWDDIDLSCFDQLLVIDGVFNLSLFMDL